MPTLLTSNIPQQYIGEATVHLPVGKVAVTIHLRFTVFGELLEYQCPILELPEAALLLTFGAKGMRIIDAEIQFMPYRLILIAFEDKKQIHDACWDVVRETLTRLKQGQDLFNLPQQAVSSLVSDMLNPKPYQYDDIKELKFQSAIYDLAVGTEFKRSSAVDDLIKLRDARSVKLLITALTDTSFNLNYFANIALGKIGESAVLPLITALSDNDVYLRRFVAKALGEIGDIRAIEPLLAALTNENNEKIACYLIRALCDIGDPVFLPLLTALSDSNENLSRYAAEALGVTGDIRAVEPLIIALTNENEKVRSTAAYALGEIGDGRAVEPLITALSDKNWSVRLSAITALGMIGDIRAVEPLINVLATKNKRERQYAATALGDIGDSSALESLISALSDKEWVVQWTAIEALGKLKDTRAIEPLIDAFSDKDNHRWQNVAVALGKLGDKRAIPLLQVRLKNESNPQLRGAIKYALQKLTKS